MLNTPDLQEGLLILCQKIYRHKISAGSVNFGKDNNEIIEFAKRNRLAHFLALEYKQLFKREKQLDGLCNSLISEYEDYQTKIKNSLNRIKGFLQGREFMVIKTFSSFPSLTSDIDVLVKDPKGLRFPIHIDDSRICFIHIEDKISWAGAQAVSNDFAWRNTQRFNFAGEEFLVPNHRLDAMIRVAHIPFELAHFKLGELLHIYRQIAQFNWQELEKEAGLMKWPKTFKKMSDMLEFLHQSIFGQPLWEKTMASNSGNKIEFPFELPVNMLAGAVIEKRAWKKLYGARFIIKERINSWIKRSIR